MLRSAKILCAVFSTQRALSSGRAVSDDFCIMIYLLGPLSTNKRAAGCERVSSSKQRTTCEQSFAFSMSGSPSRRLREERYRRADAEWRERVMDALYYSKWFATLTNRGAPFARSSSLSLERRYRLKRSAWVLPGHLVVLFAGHS